MDSNVTVLNEIHKGLVMGMESISVVSSKVGDDNFKQVLEEEYAQYGDLLDRVNSSLESTGNQGDDTTTPQRVMGWTSIQMSTITDKSNSHIAEMLINGTTMGIVKGRKLYNQYPDISDETRQTLDDFVQEQEHQVEKLKEWL